MMAMAAANPEKTSDQLQGMVDDWMQEKEDAAAAEDSPNDAGAELQKKYVNMGRDMAKKYSGEAKNFAEKYAKQGKASADKYVLSSNTFLACSRPC